MLVKFKVQTNDGVIRMTVRGPTIKECGKMLAKRLLLRANSVRPSVDQVTYKVIKK